MKYLLVVAVVVVVLWLLLRPRRGGPTPPGPGARRGAPGPVEMVACAHCGVHLPRIDALADADAHRYCSEAHRALGPR